MEEILAILDAADRQIAQKPLAAEEIEKVRERLAETRAWIADEEADLLDDEAVAGMVRDGERLLATIDARDKTIAERDAEIIRLRTETDRQTDEPLDDWIEREIARLFPDDIDIPAARLRLRVAVFVWRIVRECLKECDEERAEVRKLVEACEGERTPDAVRRALKELFDASMSEMTNLAGLAADQIEENMRVGAKGMRDACLILVTAARQGQPLYVSAAMDALRKAIATLLLP